MLAGRPAAKTMHNVCMKCTVGCVRACCARNAEDAAPAAACTNDKAPTNCRAALAKPHANALPRCLRTSDASCIQSRQLRCRAAGPLIGSPWARTSAANGLPAPSIAPCSCANRKECNAAAVVRCCIVTLHAGYARQRLTCCCHASPAWN